MHHRRRFLASFLILQMLTYSVVVAQSANQTKSTLVVNIDQSFPKEVATVLSGQIRGDGNHHAVGFSASGLEPTKLVGQRETVSARIWFIASVQDA